MSLTLGTKSPEDTFLLQLLETQYLVIRQLVQQLFCEIEHVKRLLNKLHTLLLSGNVVTKTSMFSGTAHSQHNLSGKQIALENDAPIEDSKSAIKYR